MKLHTCLIAAADERIARLFVCEREPAGRLTVKEVAALTNSNAGGHSHHSTHFPTGKVRSGQHGGPARAAANLGSATHEAEENRHRFAKDVATWLQSEATRHEATEMAVFAT